MAGDTPCRDIYLMIFPVKQGKNMGTALGTLFMQ
jgi:hypothetical protein